MESNDDTDSDTGVQYDFMPELIGHYDCLELPKLCLSATSSRREGSGFYEPTFGSRFDVGSDN